jgi:hypothetical protein
MSKDKCSHYENGRHKYNQRKSEKDRGIKWHWKECKCGKEKPRSRHVKGRQVANNPGAHAAAHGVNIHDHQYENDRGFRSWRRLGRRR